MGTRTRSTSRTAVQHDQDMHELDRLQNNVDQNMQRLAALLDKPPVKTDGDLQILLDLSIWFEELSRLYAQTLGYQLSIANLLLVMLGEASPEEVRDQLNQYRRVIQWQKLAPLDYLNKK